MEQVPLDVYIIDSLIPDLIGHDRRPAALVVYLWLYRTAARAGSWSVRHSHQSIADATGLSRSAVQAALSHLKRRQLITTTRANPTAVPLHKVHRPWRRLERA
jgi:CRP-like cAMP-binding protein